LLRSARSAGDPELLAEAHYALAVPLHFQGEFVPAREHLEQIIALYDPRRHRDHAVRYGLDPGVAARSLVAWLFWELGYPDRALEQTRSALSLARELSHPFTLAYALVLSSTIFLWRRDSSAVLELTDELTGISVLTPPIAIPIARLCAVAQTIGPSPGSRSRSATQGPIPSFRPGRSLAPTHARPTCSDTYPFAVSCSPHLKVTANNPYPAGSGNAAIFPSIPANSRRVRCPSANSNQW
jgi:hypothetical protein